jgi:uncharacterized Zn finger protein
MTDDIKRTVAKTIDRRSLLRLAGGRSFERGEAYFASGLVRKLAEHEGTVTAKVYGSREYRVKLWVAEGDLDYSCTCPVGGDGAFCKHCVAVGLASLAQPDASLAASPGRERRSGKSKKPAVTMDGVQAYLAKQDKNALVRLLMDQAMNDDRLRERLLMRAAKQGPRGLDLGTFREAIDNAVDTGEFIDYRSAYDYARGIDEVIDSIAELLQEDHAAEVIELAEHALAAVENAMGTVDDSDGHMGGILERIQELHHAACKKAKPDPEALAERLFEWELRTDWDTFYGAAARYADVLGKPGLAVYRQLAEAAWARVPAIAPGRDDLRQYGKRFRITHIMETLARESGDVEALVAVKSRDLSHACGYLQIAEIYQQAGQHDLALEWAERGVQTFPQRTDSRLREFLANEYHRRKRHDEAMALVWAEFTDSPGLERYQTLKAHADRAGRWNDWREKALVMLRQGIAKRKSEAAKSRPSWLPRADHSDLVRIFLWEKDVEGAWREAKEGGCTNDLWMGLATKREKDHPEDALAIYQKQIDPTLERKNNDAYKAAVGLLRKVRGLMVHVQRPEEFAGYLQSVRAAHKPKRNFMKLLDAAKWA